MRREEFCAADVDLKVAAEDHKLEQQEQMEIRQEELCAAAEDGKIAAEHHKVDQAEQMEIHKEEMKLRKRELDYKFSMMQ